jgi:hypothetical protein
MGMSDACWLCPMQAENQGELTSELGTWSQNQGF